MKMKRKWFVLTIVFILISALLASEGVVFAAGQRGGGGHGGHSGYYGGRGGYHGGWHGGHGGYSRGWYGRRGYYGYRGYYGGWYGFGLGVAAGVALGYPYYGYNPYYYPNYYGSYPYAYAPAYQPSVAAVEQEPVYQDAPRASAPARDRDYWYFCRESKAYYPYVKNCRGGWEKVLSTPPGSDE